MVRLTRLDGQQVVVNGDAIATIDHTPDTAITLINGVRLLVLEPVDVVVERTVTYRQAVLRGALLQVNQTPETNPDVLPFRKR